MPFSISIVRTTPALMKLSQGAGETVQGLIMPAVPAEDPKDGSEPLVTPAPEGRLPSSP